MDTSKHFRSFDLFFNVDIHFLSRTGIEIDVNVTVGFSLGLASAMVFLEAVFSSFVAGINSVTYQSTPFAILTHETVLSCNRKRTCWTNSCLASNPSSHTGLLFIERQRVLSA